MSVVMEEKALAHLQHLGLSVAGAQLDSQQAAAGQWSYSQFVDCLPEAEVTERHKKRVELNLQFAPYHVNRGLSLISSSTPKAR